MATHQQPRSNSNRFLTSLVPFGKNKKNRNIILETKKRLMLEEYCTNLTDLASQGKLDPVTARDEQIERVIQILSKRTKNNPCLVGEPGIGKTTIAKGVAQRIADGINVPERIKGKKVISLDIVSIISEAASWGNNFDRSFKEAINVIKANGQPILFIDEVQLIGAGAVSSAAILVSSVLKSALVSGDLQCIGATTTLQEYRTHIAGEPGLNRRFDHVQVQELNVDQTIQMLRVLRPAYETHHRLRYTDEALIAAAQLSYQYINDRLLPEKAIDLVDETGSRVDQRRTPGQMSAFMLKTKAKDGGAVVNKYDIQSTLSSLTGIPLDLISADEGERLYKLEETLNKRVIGQHEAVSTICGSIRRVRAGFKDLNRPIASFILLGPPSVDKSELVKALASSYFGTEKSMITFNMNDFKGSGSISTLIGLPPTNAGYQTGGKLTNAVRNRPYSVVFFHEIEKAHQDVGNLMLQILEDGTLTDSKGMTVDFKYTIIVMTTNVGEEVIEKRSITDLSDRNNNPWDEELKKIFKPELLNTVDEIVALRPHSKKDVKEIAKVMLNNVGDRLKNRNIQLSFTEKFIDRVVEEGYHPKYGAMPLGRAIKELLEDNVANKILSREIKEQDLVLVDIGPDGEVVLKRSS